MSDQQPRRVAAIIGGGASGVLASRSLRRRDPAIEVVVIDPNPGRGLAYGGAQPHHLLNTRAGSVSVDDTDPDHFVHWLNAHEIDGRVWADTDFAPRRVYGAYLQDCLEQQAQDGAVRLVRQRATGLSLAGERWRVSLEDGGEVLADAVILATGNPRPPPLQFSGRDSIDALVLDDPWDEAAIAAIPDQGLVLVVGTGLTAVDVAVSVLHRPGGPSVRLASRRGQLPRVHDRPHKRLPALTRPFPTTARSLYRRVRDLAEAVGGWDAYARHVIFLGLKPVAPEIWGGLPLVEKRRFERHLRAWWEVERHRLAPEIEALLQAGRDAGRLQTGPARIVDARPGAPGTATITLEYRGLRQEVEVTRVVNCTGPDWCVDRSRNLMLLSVLGLGGAPDEVTLGLEVDDDGEVRAFDGAALSRLYALGPLTRGQFFEITAVPEIRAMADRLARRISVDLSGETEPQPAEPQPEPVQEPFEALQMSSLFPPAQG